MEQSFLEQIIGKILDDKNVPLHDVVVVLPNRRAKRYLQRGLLASNHFQTMFLPQIFPMEEFVEWLSPLKSIDSVTQLFRLQTVTREIKGERFEQHALLSWVVPFLKDISDMDMQLQDVPAILKEYAKAAKFEITFGKDEASEADRERIFFNELLGELYEKYRKLLYEANEAYEGMIYRDCAEHIEQYAGKLPFRRFVFAGFYALSPSELEIIRYFKEHFSTEVYFDIDPFYCHLEEEGDVMQGNASRRDTSFFIHRNCQKLRIEAGELSFKEPHFATIPKTVHIVSTAGNIRQIYAAIQAVESIRKQKVQEGKTADGVVDMSDTAVALADENLLLPFLLAYRPKDVKINATMGFPFEATPVYSLLLQLLELYESAFALTADTDSEMTFSGVQVELLWEHELLRTERPSNAYFPTLVRSGQLPHSELFADISKQSLSRRLPALLLRFSQFVHERTEDSFYQKLWEEVERELCGIQSLFDENFADTEVVDFPFARYAVVRWLHDVSISIQGNPDIGLQVMGLLETRMMDFQNVIMLSVNEGILPKGITYNSLLPFDFKYKFDGQEALPSYLYQDQVYAYHFFRLLQRAKQVYLIYNQASDVSMAEKSRFISQLEYEIVDQHLEKVIEVTHRHFDFDLKLPLAKALSVPKSDEVMKRLRQFPFSASSLQCYISCPLKFYLRYLMKVQASPVLGDNLEAYELGTVIHALFKKALDEIVVEQDPTKYESILQRHIDSCDESICLEIRSLKNRESLSKSDLEQGHWLINRQIIGETVKNYLEKAKVELIQTDWSITDNELAVNIPGYQVEPIDGSTPFQVKLTGSLDRVQKNGDRVAIIDYKTGKVEESHLHVTLKKGLMGDDAAVSAALDSIFTDSKYDKLFQLVFYVLIYEHYVKEKTDYVEVGIISTREVNKNSDSYFLSGQILGERNILTYKRELSERLNMLFCDIFDAKKSFKQTDDNKKCRLCDFLHLCGRQTAAESR